MSIVENVVVLALFLFWLEVFNTLKYVLHDKIESIVAN